MDIRKIKTLIEMLEASNLNEIEVSQGEESVRISKSSGEIKVLQDSNIGINNESQSINKIDNNQIEKEIKDGILPDPNAVIDPETGMPTGQKMDLGAPVTEPDLESQGSATEAPEGGEI